MRLGVHAPTCRRAVFDLARRMAARASVDPIEGLMVPANWGGLSYAGLVAPVNELALSPERHVGSAESRPSSRLWISVRSPATARQLTQQSRTQECGERDAVALSQILEVVPGLLIERRLDLPFLSV